ncbi:Nuclease SbcCD subunit D [Bienertia sinuspersici]
MEWHNSVLQNGMRFVAIAANEAFEPPLDMSMDFDTCEDQHHECCPDQHHHCQDGNFLDSHQSSTGETMVRSTSERVDCNTENDSSSRSARETANSEIPNRGGNYQALNVNQGAVKQVFVPLKPLVVRKDKIDLLIPMAM